MFLQCEALLSTIVKFTCAHILLDTFLPKFRGLIRKWYGWGVNNKDKVGYDYDGQKWESKDCHNMAPIVFFIGGSGEDLPRWNEPAIKQTSKIECDKYSSGLSMTH